MLGEKGCFLGTLFTEILTVSSMYPSGEHI